jgi:putative sterol carrier protein
MGASNVLKLHRRFEMLKVHMLTVMIIVTLSLSDDDFGKLVSGKANAQRLFMSGKLKVKGDVMKATKMEPILKKAQTKAKL